MNWMQVAAILISVASLVLSGLTIHWSRQARRDMAKAATYRAETMKDPRERA